MPALNKESKNKASMLKMQLTTEQRIFVVKSYYKTSNYLKVKEAFCRRFQEKDPLTNSTIWKNVTNTKEKEQVLNINRGRSRKRRTIKTEETIEVVRLYVENNARNVSCGRN